MTEIQFKSEHPMFNLPVQAREGDAGFDCRYCGEEPLILPLISGAVLKVPLGFSMSLPSGFEAQVRPRSGYAWNDGVAVLNSPGTVDCNYRGLVSVLLVRGGMGQVDMKNKGCESNVLDSERNFDLKPYNELIINPGDRVCQIVIKECPRVDFELVEELDETDRGEGGFGSTGA